MNKYILKCKKLYDTLSTLTIERTNLTQFSSMLHGRCNNEQIIVKIKPSDLHRIKDWYEFNTLSNETIFLFVKSKKKQILECQTQDTIACDIFIKNHNVRFTFKVVSKVARFSSRKTHSNLNAAFVNVTLKEMKCYSQT